MPSSITPNENAWGDPGAEPPQNIEPIEEPSAAAPEIPAPPQEVKVRTMQSDIESMVSSGGGAPKFKSVKIEVRRPEEEEKIAEAKIKNRSAILTAIVVLLALGIVIAVGFLFYKLFSGNPAGGTPSLQTSVQTPQPGASGPSATAQNPSQSAPPGFVHQSFLRKPVDQTLGLLIRSTAQNSFDLQTYGQKLLGILSSASATSKFFEINVGDENGSWGAVQLFSYADIAAIDQTFFLAHFTPDATMFVYKDANGFWPGYILELKPSENWLFLKNDVAKLEQSPKIPNFFLMPPGNPSPDGFKDEIFGDATTRSLKFAAPGAAFSYSWIHGYLVLSTSDDGLKEALARL